MRPVRDKVMGQERNLQGGSSSHGAAPGPNMSPAEPPGRETSEVSEPASQLFPSRLSQGPGMSLSSFCLTVVGLCVNF